MLSSVGLWSSMLKSCRAAVLLAAVAFAGANPSFAEEDTLLVLQNGVSDPIKFDLAALDALPQHSFDTSTQWTEGTIAFSGPALKDILDAAQISQVEHPTIRLIAANQYEVTLEKRLLEDDVPIVATRLNGQTFGVRDKGPLWVVFPYDLKSSYQTEGVYAASIWQLVEIKIVH